MGKLSMTIPPFSDWFTARQALNGVVQNISDYLSKLPPPTDFLNQRLTSVADPVQVTDAVNLEYLQKVLAPSGVIVGTAITSTPTIFSGWLKWSP